MSHTNDTNVNNMNTTSLFPNVSDLRRLLRKCSYCRETGHNISNCNHNSLSQFHDLCITIKIQTENPLLFAHWLATTSLELINGNTLIKSYGVSKHGCRLRDNMHIIIEKITNNMYGLIENINEDYVRLPELDTNNRPSIFSEMISFSLMTNLLSRVSTHTPIHPQEEEVVIKLIYNKNVNKDIDNIECPVCYETKDNTEIIKLNCNHNFCKCCTKQIVNNKPDCPCCRKKIDQIIFNTQDTGKYFVGENNWY